ncbi:uncharacterized protein [Asterias amurensis]|uniref:uncharacterized protein n=1 Tax=Asterias amurensis TaxID=7602 RepID=UPI003AB19304
MRCYTQKGKPEVNMDIVSLGESYTWQQWNYPDVYIRLGVRATDNGSSYDCRMTSSGSRFSGMERTCTIGPMTVVPMTTLSFTTTQPTTEHPDASINSTAASQQPTSLEIATASEEGADGAPSSISALPWIAAFLVTLLLLVILVIINIIFIVKHLQRSNSKETVQTNTVKTGSAEEQFKGDKVQFKCDKAFYKVPTSKKTLQDQDCRQKVKNSCKISEDVSVYEVVTKLQRPVYQNVKF